MAETVYFEVWAGFAVLLLVLGVLGNALTLWAILYATRRNKPQFEGDNWYKTTVFILNLAVVDMVYCLFTLGYMFYGFLLWLKAVDEDGETSGICKFFLLNLQHLAQVDGWSIALIAITRAIPYIK